MDGSTLAECEPRGPATPADPLHHCVFDLPSASDQAFSATAEATEDAMRTEQDGLFSAHAHAQTQARDYIGF